MSKPTYHYPLFETSVVEKVEQWEVSQGDTHFFYLLKGNECEADNFTVAMWKFKRMKPAEPKVIDCRYITGHDLDKF